MNEVEQLKHRIAMIADDMSSIKKFIDEQGLNKTFTQPTSEAEECWHHFSNIDIACNLANDESLNWKLFSK